VYNKSDKNDKNIYMNEEKKSKIGDFAFLISKELGIGYSAGYQRARRACQNYQVKCKQVGKTWVIDTSSITEYLNGKKND